MKRPDPPLELKATWCWVVVDPWGDPMLASTNYLRREAVDEVMGRYWPDRTWRQMYRIGYRVKHVMIYFPVMPI